MGDDFAGSADLLKLFQWDTKQDQCLRREISANPKSSWPSSPAAGRSERLWRPAWSWKSREIGSTTTMEPVESNETEKLVQIPPIEKGYHTVFPRGLSKKKPDQWLIFSNPASAIPKKGTSHPVELSQYKYKSGKVHGTSVGNLPWHIPFDSLTSRDNWILGGL